MLTQLLFVGRLLASSTSWCVCMYLYVLGFSKHPSLLKVGVSKSPIGRVAKLESVHGKCTSSEFYNMGKLYTRAEKLLHMLLEESNVRVDGEGGTEFFKADEVAEVVEKVVALCGGMREEIKKVVEFKEATPVQKIYDKSAGSTVSFENEDGDFVEYNLDIINMFDIVCCGAFTITDTGGRVVIKTDQTVDVAKVARASKIFVRVGDCLINFDPLKIAFVEKSGGTVFSFLDYECAKSTFFDSVNNHDKGLIEYGGCRCVIDCLQTFYYLCSQYTGKFYEDNVKYIEGISV